jgi:hypothetical protein
VIPFHSNKNVWVLLKIFLNTEAGRLLPGVISAWVLLRYAYMQKTNVCDLLNHYCLKGDSSVEFWFSSLYSTGLDYTKKQGVPIQIINCTKRYYVRCWEHRNPKHTEQLYSSIYT